MRFERSRELPDGRVESQCDGIGVLVCCVERVAQVHQKGVAAPTEAVLDIQVRELGAMEEVRGRDADGVTGPCEEVLVVGRYVKDLVSDLSEEGGHLGYHDQFAYVGALIAVDSCRVVVWCIEAPCTSCNVEAGLYGAHPMGIRLATVSEGLAVVIVLLLSEAE